LVLRQRLQEGDAVNHPVCTWELVLTFLVLILPRRFSQMAELETIACNQHSATEPDPLDGVVLAECFLGEQR